tara:strand:- start:3697 stop:4392 length:696 start_codon:yes stop_codon:yes gene_type:complete
MPVKRIANKWYWGNQGPFDTRKKAEEVQRAAHASGYQNPLQKIAIGARQEGPKPNIPKKTAFLELKKKQLYFQCEVDYRLATHEEYARNEKCDSCFFWKDNGACHIVLGNIEPYMWCNQWHESAILQKEDGGGDGGGALAGGGTVFTSTNSGIFNPTYGGNGRKTKKKTGIDRLAQFITENSPQKKMFKAWGSGSAEVDELHRAGKKDILERDEEQNEPEVTMIEENKKKQ